MSLNTFRQQWMRWHGRYEKQAFRIIRKNLKEHTAKIPFERSNQYNVIAFLEMYVDKSVFEQMYLEIYKEIGLKHGRRVGAYINRQINQKDFSFGTFADLFLADVQKMLLGQGGSKIVTVRQNYIDFLMELITKQYNEGKTTSEVTDAIYKYIRSREFYRWQGMRIARTETTTASNFAAVRASAVSGVVMEKVWISAQDSRTRRIPEDKFDHYSMNGQTVLLTESFNVSGEQLEYPGDQQNGSAGNVINCRCTVAQRVKRDSAGNIIRVDSAGRAITPLSIVQTTSPSNNFIPAKTVGDAEIRIRKLGIKKVSLRGLKPDEYNSVLKTMENESAFSKLDLNELSVTNSPRSNFNGRYFSSDKKIQLNVPLLRKHRKAELKTYNEQINQLQGYLDDVENQYGNVEVSLSFRRKLDKYKRQVNQSIKELQNKIETNYPNKYWSVSSQADSVAEKFSQTLIHEIGHNRHYQQLRLYRAVGDWQRRSISEYGETNFKEYLVEWYTYWRLNGDKNVPITLLKLFKTL